jgi:Galactose oxidase, central domain
MHLYSRSVIALLGIIAVAGAIGIVVSFGQHSPAAAATHLPATPSGRQPITPSPVPAVPQSGFGFSVADDPATHQIVLFGGVGDYENTWLWDGSGWSLAHPPASPEGRFGASEAYDPQTRTVMLFGGRIEPGTPVHDTWAWNGATWDALDSGAGGPDPGEGSDMAWDPALSQMVLLTRSGVISNPATTWVWSVTHWTQPGGAKLPAGASYSPMWFDPVSRSLLAVGCCVGPPPATGAAGTTWRWNGGTWILLPASADAPVSGSTMALDPAIDRLVLCACGTPPTRSPAVFAWSGSHWTATPAGPPPVDGATATTDPDRDQLLFFGTPRSGTLPGHSPVEVWSLTGATWHRLDPAP